MADFLFVEHLLKNWYLIHYSYKIVFRNSFSMFVENLLKELVPYSLFV